MFEKSVYIVRLGVMAMVFNATFKQLFRYIVEVSFISGENRSTRRKTTDLPQVITNKLDHIILYRVHLTWAGFELTTLVVIGTDCTGSYKSNYQPYNDDHDDPSILYEWYKPENSYNSM